MVRRVGAGDHAVLCLHGWFGSADGWGFFPEVVDGERFSWLFPEMRGYGERRGESGDFTMWEYAADAIAAADELGLDSFSVVGHSMGGKAAAALLAQAPERVRALVGLCAVGPGPVPLDADGEALFFGAPTQDANRRGIIDFTTGNRNSDTWLDAMLAHSRATSTVEAFTGAVNSWVSDDYTDRIGRPETPIALIVGAHDPALGAETMRQTWMQLYPDTTLIELAGSGHYPMHEEPVTLATQVERFLADR